MSRKDENFPIYAVLVESTFKALVALDGSGSNDEILEAVIKILNLPDSVVDKQHKGSQETELEYQLAWARSDLKKYGAINNVSRGIWKITSEFANQKEIDAKKVQAQNSVQYKKSSQGNPGGAQDEPEQPWKTKLAQILCEINPYAFERLAQLLLRTCGFSQMQVTKKSADGGIDGTGKLRINGIFSFNVAFQCKRYSGIVSAGDIRDFRGSLTADIEKGIFITTGTFSRAAKEEASKTGKQQIDLIDGEELINMLKENGIGVRKKLLPFMRLMKSFLKNFLIKGRPFFLTATTRSLQSKQFFRLFALEGSFCFLAIFSRLFLRNKI